MSAPAIARRLDGRESEDTEGSCPCARGGRVGSAFVVRFAGLRGSVLSATRSADAAVRVEEILDLQDWLDAEAQALSDALYEPIGQLQGGSGMDAPRPLQDAQLQDAQDASLRPRLVGLRRDLRQGRRPAARAWDEDVARALPVAVADRVRRWIQRLAEHRRGVSELPAALAADAERALPALRGAAGEPMFRRALSQASPTLAEELDKWLAGDRQRRRAQVLDRLAKYLSRAAAKTSPYSTFMVSGYGTWAPEGPAIRFALPPTPRTTLEPDRLFIASVVRALVRRSDLAAAAPLRVSPGALDAGDTIRLLGPPPGEPIVRVGATAALRACLRAVDRDPPISRAALVAELAAAAGGDVAAARRFVDRLVDLGLLEPRSPVTDPSADPLGELLAWLEAAAPEGAQDPLADPIRRLRDELRREVPVADVEGHRERLQGAGEQAIQLATELGMHPAATALRKRPAAIAHESAVVSSPVAWCARPQWQPALADLEVIRRWLPVHDPTLPLRVVLGAYVGERMGVGARVPFLHLHEAVQRELTGAAGASSGAAGASSDAAGASSGALLAELRRWFDVVRAVPASWLAGSPLARLRELHGLRLAALRPLDASPGADGVVRVDPAALAETLAARPAWARAGTPGSIGCFVQPLAPLGPEVRIAVNAVTVGYGRGQSRLRHLIKGAGDEQAAPWRADPGCPHGPVVAEIGGAFGTALNGRVPAAPYEIDYPYAASRRPPGERLPLGDLFAVHDPGTGLLRLESARLGRPVRVVHLGLMFEGLLPPAARLLVRMSGFTVLPPGWVDAEPALPSNAPDEVVASPRVEVGHVVLRRARWIVRAAAVPERAGGSDADYLLRMARWRRRHGIPSRAFVRVVDAAATAAGGVFDKSRKPVYVDWAHGLLASTFERMVRGRHGLVVLEEPVPAPDETAGPEGRVIELLIELYGCEGHGC